MLTESSRVLSNSAAITDNERVKRPQEEDEKKFLEPPAALSLGGIALRMIGKICIVAMMSDEISNRNFLGCIGTGSSFL